MRISARIAGAGFSLVLAVVGVAAALVGVGYGMTDDEGQVGPGFLPVAFGAVLAVLAAADVLLRLARRAPRDTVEDLVEESLPVGADDDAVGGDDVDIFGRTQRQRTRILVLVVVSLVAAILLTYLVGLTIAFGLLMLGIAIGLERRPVVSSIIISVVATAVIWVVFRQLLSVPLPTGLLGLL